MKIAFVTSGLEPGADGVGDYTRRIASELRRNGHACRLIALNENRTAPSEEPNVLRLGADTPWTERIARAKEFIEEFRPDWASLQFVCYGFDPKGFIRNRIDGLASLLSQRPAHIMLHELWAGETVDAGWKQRLIGRVQRKYVLDLVARVGLRLVSVTNPVHRAILRRCGIEAREYRLFGNVEVTPGAAGAWLEAPRAGHWLFGFFGTIQSEWSPEPLFSQIAEAARRCGKRPVIIWAGRPGRGDDLWNRMARDYAPGFSFLRLGPQPEGRVSELLNTLDAGISSMPLELILKSGTAAAMFEHGLPVIVTRREPFRGVTCPPPAEPLLCVPGADFADRLAAGLHRGPKGSRLPEAAARMAADLEESEG